MIDKKQFLIAKHEFDTEYYTIKAGTVGRIVRTDARPDLGKVLLGVSFDDDEIPVIIHFREENIFKHFEVKEEYESLLNEL